MTNPRPKPALHLNRLLDWFVPAELAADREARQRAHMFLISHVAGPFIGSTIPGYLFFIDPEAGYRIGVLAASIVAFWIYPFVLRKTGRYTLLALVSVQNLLFSILWGCYFYGGVTSPFLPWLLTVPLLAFFYLGSGRRAVLSVMGIIGANLGGFYILYRFDNFPHDADHISLQGIGIVSTLAASVYVSMMALYYGRVVASGVELEEEMREHLATAAELRSATAEAERAGAAKAEFLAKMSHELRTPLNAVIGYSQMLLEDAQAEGDKAGAADLEKIHGAGHHLLRLVNEVLDLSKIEAGKMELAPEETDIGALVRDTAESCRTQVTEHGNELVVEIDERLGRILCDARKVQMVILQLVENAAKFTSNGKVTVRAQPKPGAHAQAIHIAIRDTGAGIPADRIPLLFENFHVAEDASPTKYGGTGLGLALSLKLSRLMGGDIAVQSEVGAGSCFTIELPIAPPQSAAAKALAGAAEDPSAAVLDDAA